MEIKRHMRRILPVSTKTNKQTAIEERGRFRKCCKYRLNPDHWREWVCFIHGEVLRLGEFMELFIQPKIVEYICLFGQSIVLDPGEKEVNDSQSWVSRRRFNVRSTK